MDNQTTELVQDYQQMATQILMAIWRGTPSEYKSKYRMNIWDQFQNQIISATTTNSVAKFISSACFKLGAQLGATDEERSTVNAVIGLISDERKLLRTIRNDITLLVLKLRVANQERSDEWKRAQAERGNE